jgi:L-lactate dehydrogenase complex protein LldG
MEEAEPHMSARDAILASIRRSLGVTGTESPRLKVVADRIAGHPVGVIPKRGQLPPDDRADLFAEMVELAAGSIARVETIDGVAAEIARYLRQYNLPLAAQRGVDARLAAVPWHNEPALVVSTEASPDNQLASVAHAFGAVAETGTLVLTSGPDNPTSLNFLPDIHIVLVDAKEIAGDYEAVIARLRQTYGTGEMPRVVNLITGPSRSADIEQKLILGAHGPRRLHVIVVGAPA